MSLSVENIVINAVITILSLGLLVVALASYSKYKNLKLLFVSLVFLVLFIKGLLFSVLLFQGNLNTILSSPYVGLFDLIILVLLFIATLKR